MENAMDGQFAVLRDLETDLRYRMRLHNGNLYTYEWKEASEGKPKGWYLLNTVVKNPMPDALDTTTYYAE